MPHLSDSSESDDEERSWGTEGGADGGRGARSGVLPANLVRLVVAHNRWVGEVGSAGGGDVDSGGGLEEVH